jgi:HEAT repeat protein
MKARSAVPALLAGLKDPDDRVRRQCAWSLGFMEPADKRIVPALIAVVQAKETNWGAVQALGFCGSHGKAAVPVLVKFLKAKKIKSTELSEDTWRPWVIKALERIGPDAKDAVPSLIAIVRDHSAEMNMRQAAAYALGEIGPAAKAAVPDLEELQKKGCLDGRGAAVLEKIQED